MKLFIVSLAVVFLALNLSACKESAPPSQTELTQALKAKLAEDHASVEAKLKTIPPGLEHRSLSESLAMQRAQTLTVSHINQCTPEKDSDQQSCDVLLNISMQGMPGSQERNVILQVSTADNQWLVNKMSLPKH